MAGRDGSTREIPRAKVASAAAWATWRRLLVQEVRWRRRVEVFRGSCGAGSSWGGLSEPTRSRSKNPGDGSGWAARAGGHSHGRAQHQKSQRSGSEAPPKAIILARFANSP